MIKIDLYNSATNNRIENVLNSYIKKALYELNFKLLSSNYTKSYIYTSIYSLNNDYEYDGFLLKTIKDFHFIGETVYDVVVNFILYKKYGGAIECECLQSFSVEIMSPAKERKQKIEDLGLL